MSHFTVLVIGDNPEHQLAPFQENNMGSCPKEFLEFTSVEGEYREEYESKGMNKVFMPDGRKLSTFDDEFRVKGSIGIGTHTHEVPKHLPVKEVPFLELYETFENFMNDYHGYKEKDELTGKYGYWENPNAKWDWYQLGGRWRGYFKLKYQNAKGNLGESGAFDNAPEYDVDQARKGQIDFEKMKDIAGEKAKERYEKVEKLCGGSIPELTINWRKDMWDGGKYADLDIAEKRRLYNNQPALLKLEKIKEKINKKVLKNSASNCSKRGANSVLNALKANPLNFVLWLDIADYQLPKEEYIYNARNSSFVTFAVLKDGKWFEQGRMGWWAVVHDEKDVKEWNNQFCTLVENLSDDTLLSVYDCHI